MANHLNIPRPLILGFVLLFTVSVHVVLYLAFPRSPVNIPARVEPITTGSPTSLSIVESFPVIETYHDAVKYLFPPLDTEKTNCVKTCEQHDCAVYCGYEDGFGSQVQCLSSIIYVASLNPGYTPCLVLPEKDMAHVTVEEKYVLLRSTGFMFRSKNECAKCSLKTFVRENKPAWHLNFTRAFQKLYTSPFADKTSRYFVTGKTNVAFHFRVRNEHDERDQTWDYDLLKRVMQDIRNKYPNPVFLLFTQNSIDNNQPWKPLTNFNDVNVIMDSSPVETFDAMVKAPVLITAESSFSYVAALYNSGDVYFIPYHMGKMPHWVDATML